MHIFNLHNTGYFRLMFWRNTVVINPKSFIFQHRKSSELLANLEQDLLNNPNIKYWARINLFVISNAKLMLNLWTHKTSIKCCIMFSLFINIFLFHKNFLPNPLLLWTVLVSNTFVTDGLPEIIGVLWFCENAGPCWYYRYMGWGYNDSC